MGDLTKEQSVRDTENMAALRELATKAVTKACTEEVGYRGYKPEDIDPDQVPLAIDLTEFVLWLRHNSDFFSGPNLDIHYPEHNSPDFTDVLGELAIIYTGE